MAEVVPDDFLDSLSRTLTKRPTGSRRDCKRPSPKILPLMDEGDGHMQCFRGMQSIVLSPGHVCRTDDGLCDIRNCLSK